MLDSISYETKSIMKLCVLAWDQGLHRLEKYLNLECFLEKSLKIKSALKSTGKSLKGLENPLSFTIFFRNKHCR